jgi:hypothetical protein
LRAGKSVEDEFPLDGLTDIFGLGHLLILSVAADEERIYAHQPVHRTISRRQRRRRFS